MDLAAAPLADTTAAIPPSPNNPMPHNSTLMLNGSGPITIYMSTTEAVIASVLWSLIILCAIVGNVMVIFAIFKSPALYIVQNFLLVSLAVADILVAVLVMPFSLTSTLMGQWIFGRGFCLFHVTCDVLLCTASILHLVAIALDR
ncbi:hypothetical protein RvY_06401 [Ramazzottius varieornatus]|uniref:G-protein coupled receptors family 1 profile domain-containing protein n=1 Tax=Ramazzottius varieornatus TaxID=947166 RepID=A0A1D1V763_RAMVA|nr:hypothetical protein RvY_06401 [Ramazzottius varieornatus]